MFVYCNETSKLKRLPKNYWCISIKSHRQSVSVLIACIKMVKLTTPVNTHNCRYWSTENLCWMMEHNTKHQQNFNMWAGIVRQRIIYPYFLVDNLAGRDCVLTLYQTFRICFLMVMNQVCQIVIYSFNKMRHKHTL